MATTKLPILVYESLYQEAQGQYKRLYLPLTVKLSTGQTLTIPEGFKTDLATVPRLFWGVVSPSGRHDLAVIVHDYLLEQGWERKEADRELLYFLKLSQVGWLKRNLMYFAVRVYSMLKSTY
jgi:hypothetical protein